MAENTAIGETASTVGGWFGDIMEGIKPAAVDALGFTIRQKAGLIDANEAMRQYDFGSSSDSASSTTPNVTANQANQANATNNTLILMALGVVAFMVLAEDD